jgi:hypothetical protein
VESSVTEAMTGTGFTAMASAGGRMLEKSSEVVVRSSFPGGRGVRYSVPVR